MKCIASLLRFIILFWEGSFAFFFFPKSQNTARLPEQYFGTLGEWHKILNFLKKYSFQTLFVSEKKYPQIHCNFSLKILQKVMSIFPLLIFRFEQNPVIKNLRKKSLYKRPSILRDDYWEAADRLKLYLIAYIKTQVSSRFSTTYLASFLIHFKQSFCLLLVPVLKKKTIK